MIYLWGLRNWLCWENIFYCAGFGIGSYGYSIGSVRIGSAYGSSPTQESGLDVGIGEIFGTSTAVYGAWEDCCEG